MLFEDNGADVLLSMPQTYVLKASEAELMARFDKFSAATDKPLVLYNSPRRMGVFTHLQPRATRALA
jgi:4-hydroxy-tetrahydrodipicolinate synthase